MADAQTPEPQPSRTVFTRSLDAVQWLGNLLPHPVTLLIILPVGIVPFIRPVGRVPRRGVETALVRDADSVGIRRVSWRLPVA